MKRVMLLATVALCIGTASAQLEIGDNIKLRTTGSLGFNYSGSFGNQSGSNHGQALTGELDTTGYYFHPNFLTFQFRPFFNRNQTNSDSQLINRSNGVGASLGLFSGSRFPGSITYGKDFSSNNEFRLAGVPTISSDGSNRNFGVSWSALVPNLPQLTASYTSSSAASSFLDFGDNTSSSKMLTLNASYVLKGFNLQSSISRYAGKFDTPAALTVERFKSDSHSLSYNASASHALPLRGSIGLAWSRTTSDQSTGNEYTTNTYTLSNSFTPVRRVSIFQNVNYFTNLFGSLLQSFNGAVTEGTQIDSESKGLFYNTGASYYLGRGISLGGYYNYRNQELEGKTFTDSQYGGNISFTHTNRFFGFLSLSIGASDTANALGNTGAGANIVVSANKKIRLWETAADYSYTQNLTTLGSVTPTSNYSYGGSLRRKVNRDFSFGGAYRGARSGMVAESGNGNASNSFSGMVQVKKYSFGGSYSKSDGTAVLNNSGTLTPTPEGSLISKDLLLFNATSYSITASTTLFRKIGLAGGFSKFDSDTLSSLSGVRTDGERYNATMRYNLRKFQVNAGFSHTMQNVSSIPGGPRVINSYYFGLSRWFNVF